MTMRRRTWRRSSSVLGCILVVVIIIVMVVRGSWTVVVVGHYRYGEGWWSPRLVAKDVDVAWDHHPVPVCHDDGRPSATVRLDNDNHEEDDEDDYPRIDVVVPARLAGLPQGIHHPLFDTCPPTCHIKLILSCPYWELETVDCHNRTKTVGGDEFYITYSSDEEQEEEETPSNHKGNHKEKKGTTRPVSAVAWWKDQQNGRYQLDFQATPMSQSHVQSQSQSKSSGGVLTVYLQYTCGIGRMAPPLKSVWPHGGQTVGVARWTLSLSAMGGRPPFIRPFELPSHNNNHNNNERPNLFQFSTIVPVGDSLLQNFLKPLDIHFPNINNPLNSTTLERWKQSIEFQLNRRGDYSTSAIIAGSCAWDILDSQNTTTTTTTTTTNTTRNHHHDHPQEWHDHRVALTNLLTHTLQTYPQITVFWKSCAAFHIHVPQLYTKFQPGGRLAMERRLKYMSTSRAESLRRVQTDVVRQLQQQEFPHHLFLLNVYPAYYLSAHLARPGDGRHFQEILDIRTSQWFTNETTIERLWRERRSMDSEEPFLVTYDDHHEHHHHPTNNNTGLWIHWVNAALFAKVTRRTLVWQDRETTITQFDQGGWESMTMPTTQQQYQEPIRLLNSTSLFKDKRIRKKPSAHKFIMRLFAKEESTDTEQHVSLLYAMIFHRVLVDLSTRDQSNAANPSLVVVGKEGQLATKTTLVIAPFSDPSPTAHRDQCLEKHLSRILAAPSTKSGIVAAAPMDAGCEILVPSEDWAKMIAAALERGYSNNTNTSTNSNNNCRLRIQSFNQPSEILRVATQLAESWSMGGSSSGGGGGLTMILSCSMTTSQLFWQLVNYLMQVRARRLGILPFDEVFSYCCV